jgi:hypothetical protein
MASRILTFCTRWMRVVSFTHRPLYHPGKRVKYRLNRRLAGHQDRSGRFREEGSFVRLPAMKHVSSIDQSVA